MILELIRTIFITQLRSRSFFLLTFIFIGSYYFFSNYNFVFNFISHSLPQKLFITKVGDKDLIKGDYVVFKARNLPNTPNNTRIVKLIAGVEGDTVSIKNNDVFINDEYLTHIYTDKAFWGSIHPLANTKIPKGCYFLEGTAKTSFDSRYKEFGLICKNQIVGKSYPFF